MLWNPFQIETPNFGKITSFCLWPLTVPDEPVQGLVCTTYGRVCPLHPAFWDINLFCFFFFYYIISFVLAICSSWSFNAGKNDGSWWRCGIFPAFYASNNLCGFHFFIIQPIRLKYLVVTSGLNWKSGVLTQNSAFL